MHGLIARSVYLALIEQRLRDFPAVALLGARQVGKSTLAQTLLAQHNDSLYLDLENQADLNKLTDPDAYFQQFRAGQGAMLICIDEVQRAPELFAALRVAIDRNASNGQFLILGSASRDLIRQSSESLAGRISYIETTPFSRLEVADIPLETVWLRGGYPRSLLARNDDASVQWRIDYIRTFLERDIPQLGFTIPAVTLGRLWRMLSHTHGEPLNASKLASAMGVSSHTVRKYIELLHQTFVVRTLPPWHSNLGKRLIKSPKVYIRDSGILHSLLDIEHLQNLYSHPVYGHSFEGFVIENIITAMPKWRPFFYRTANSNEIDLVLEKGQDRIAIEIKASSSPKVSKSFWAALRELKVTQSFIVGQVDQAYPYKEDTWVCPLDTALRQLGKHA